MKKHLLTAGLVLLLAIIALAVYIACRQYITSQHLEYERLTAATNCQTDVVGPFIQTNRLAHAVPNEALRKDFEAFLNAQVSEGFLSREAARQILEEIQNRGQEPPVYTARGWVLPILVQSR